MGSCYVCGAYVAPNEGYRRKVNTGDSFGLSFGKRITPSTRTYYGVRTLCAYCAKKHDEWEKIKGALVLVAIGLFVFFYLIGYHSDNNATSYSKPAPLAVDRENATATQKSDESRALEENAAVETVSTPMIVNAPQELNVRSGPGTSFSVISKVHSRDIVTVQRTEKGWSYIGSGWVRSKFLAIPNN